jgi:DNA-binding MarR family transcriptional regulator
MIEEKNYENKSIRDLIGELTKVYFIKSYKIVAEKGIHPGQEALLRLVSEEPGLSQKEIAKKLNIQPPTVAVSIRRLEKAGWLERGSDSDDKRISRVYISEAGSQLVKEINMTSKEIDNWVFKGISEAEMCLLKRILIQLIQNLRETIDENEIKEIMQKFKEHHDKEHTMCD